MMSFMQGEGLGLRQGLYISIIGLEWGGGNFTFLGGGGGGGGIQVSPSWMWLN